MMREKHHRLFPEKEGIEEMGLKDIPDGIPDDHVFVCVGHGSINTTTDKGKLTFTVPEKVWIVFWVQDGETLAGKAIEEYRNNIKQVDPRMMRGGNPDLDGYAPLKHANRRMAGVIAPEVRQSIAAASAAASRQEAQSADQLTDRNRRQAWGPGQLGSVLDHAAQQGVNAGELTAMRQELATNRGILRPVAVPDSRSLRAGLPEVIAPGHACPSYRLTYDPELCEAYRSGGKNKFNAGPLPAYLLSNPKFSQADPISERGTPLEVFARLVANKAAPAVLHWAACRSHRER